MQYFESHSKDLELSSMCYCNFSHLLFCTSLFAMHLCIGLINADLLMIS